MQLMPATARAVARELGLAHADYRLTADTNHNIRLGSAYLAGLLDDFDGSYVLALAGYNAGPGRVRQWLREFGDPRNGGADVIDWIESIPIAETRNYVQRVLENLQLYRLRLGQTLLARGPAEDLGWRR
jgi:soluble lytic murein transglycosylase